MPYLESYELREYTDKIERLTKQRDELKLKNHKAAALLERGITLTQKAFPDSPWISQAEDLIKELK